MCENWIVVLGVTCDVKLSSCRPRTMIWIRPGAWCLWVFGYCSRHVCVKMATTICHKMLFSSLHLTYSQNLLILNLKFICVRMQKIQALIAPPENDETSKPGKKREGLDLHPYYKRPGKGHNRDCCDACSEGGNLICCDKCPASFHLACQ